MTMTTPSYERWNALILHPPHGTVDAIIRQLMQMNIRAESYWPDLPGDFDPDACNIVFFDADLGHESQFFWDVDNAPFPMVALIGSEAPGRIAWAIRQGADAHLLKPVGSSGIYSAVMIASRAYAMRIALREKTEGLKARLDQRECLAQATAHLMASGSLSAQAAYRTLRLMAMSERLSIEKMATVLLDRVSGVHKRSDRA